MIRTTWRSEIPSTFGPISVRGSGPNSGAAHAVIVLHGMDRSANRYHRQAAEAMPDAIVLAPEFDAMRFPGWRSYNLARMTDADGRAVGESRTLYPALETLIEYARGLSEDVSIYGHSAGAQLLQRWALFRPHGLIGARLAVANAGWFTEPDPMIPFPYGLAVAPLTADLAGALALPLHIFVGEDDASEDHHALRRDAGADRQGLNRKARAVFLLNSARRVASRFGFDCNWSLTMTPGAGHSNAEMIRAAAPILLAPGTLG